MRIPYDSNGERKHLIYTIIDIRICGISNELLTRFEYTVSCSFTDSQDCSHYFYPYINDSYDPYLVLNGGQTRCQIFIPPRDIYFQSNAATYPSELKDKMVFRVFKNNASVSVSSFYITYFASQNSPYRTFFGMSGDDSEMSQQDAIDWIGAAAETMNLQNTYSFDNSVHVNSRYSLNETRYLTGSSWNYFGFANIYNTTHGITPSFNPITVPLNGGVNSSSSWDLTFSLTVEPSDYTIRSIKEQKVSTILGGLASAGGVFSAFMALQTLLFGFRPDSPWEIVHRWSWGRQSESLRDQLNVGNSPVPMATRVRGEYHLLPESSDSTTLEMVPLNENDGDQSDGSKLRKMEDRMQLMEDLFKTYYIDDEVFQKLNEARKNNTSKSNEKSEKVEGESSFTSINQENEEAPMSQIDHKRDSKVLP
jgi:hypothetical protein